MLKKALLLSISSIILFQVSSMAGNSKKLDEKDKTDFYSKLLTIGNLACYDDKLKSMDIKEGKICDIGQSVYLSYLITKTATELRPDKNATTFQALEELSGLKVLKNSDPDISYYNPEIIEWLFDTFYAKPKDTILSKATTEYYEALFKNRGREYARAYIGLQKGGLFDKAVKEYKESIKKSPYSGPDYLYSFLEKLKLDVKGEPREYEDDLVIGFWLRRGIDGTDKVCWKALKTAMEDYDKEWFESIQK